MGVWNSLGETIKTFGKSNIVDKVIDTIPSAENAASRIGKAFGVAKAEIESINYTPFARTALVGKLAIGAGTGILGNAILNEIEDKKGGYGNAAILGGIAAAGLFRGKGTAKTLSTMYKRSRVAAIAGGAVESSSLFKNIIEAKRGSWLHFEDPLSAYAKSISAAKGAAFGALAGGIYGGVDDNNTIGSGIFKGAIIGATMGAFSNNKRLISRIMKNGINNKEKTVKNYILNRRNASKYVSNYNFRKYPFRNSYPRKYSNGITFSPFSSSIR